MNNYYSIKEALIDWLRDVSHIINNGERDRLITDIYIRWVMLWQKEVVVQDSHRILLELDCFCNICNLLSYVPQKSEFQEWVQILFLEIDALLNDITYLLNAKEEMGIKSIKTDAFPSEIRVKDYWIYYFRNEDHEWFIKHPEKDDIWCYVSDVITIGRLGDNLFSVQIMYQESPFSTLNKEWIPSIGGNEKLSRTIPIKSSYRFSQFKYKVGQTVYSKRNNRYGKIIAVSRKYNRPVYRVRFEGNKSKEQDFYTNELIKTRKRK